MLTLSGAPDRVVSWSDFSVQHENVRHLTGSAFIGFVILIKYWYSVVVELQATLSGIF